MSRVETIEQLTRFDRRGSGTDAERRAARWLASELDRTSRQVRTETFWCRPNWALAHSWHVGLAIAGSLVSVATPRAGGALLVAALASMISDWATGLSVGRRLTPERASQNVVAPADDQTDTRIVITANYDAGRTALVYRDFFRAGSARLRRAAGGFVPGWLGWIALAMAWLLVTAILRLEGSRGTGIGVAQLPPTAALVMALAALLDIASSSYGPAAGDNGTGVAAALALVRALDAAPPQRVAVEVVLAGAGEGGGIGLRKYLRTRKRELFPANTVVLGVAPCAAGHPRWWLSDGQLLPLRYSRRLRQLCRDVADTEPQLAARAHRGRGATPALPARVAGLPAIAIGCLDAHGQVRRSHQPTDTATAIDPGAVDKAVQFGLMLIDAIDVSVSEAADRQSTTVDG
jgi:hypothetical protein